ncbi:MAG: LysE family transporter [Actinobacteria bacterium]|nr:LysE family transporter [Actinomycetota bacterium]
MIHAIVAGLLAGLAIAMPVGAISVLIVTLAARDSLRRGLAAGVGAATADGVYATLAVTGGVALSSVLVPVGGPARRVAGVVLVGIAVRGVLRAARSDAGRVTEPAFDSGGVWRTYLGVLGLTLLNPVTVVYFAALVLGGAAGGVSAATRTAFVAAAFAASLCWQSVLAAGGAILGRALTGPRGRRATALVGNAVILGLAVVLLSS